MCVNWITKVFCYQDTVIVKRIKLSHEFQIHKLFSFIIPLCIQFYLDNKTNNLDDRKCSYIAHGLLK